MTEPVNTPRGAKECPSFDQVVASKESYAKACKIQFLEQDQITGKTDNPTSWKLDVGAKPSHAFLKPERAGPCVRFAIYADLPPGI